MGRGEEGCASKKGLLCDMTVINIISIWSPIVFAGIYAATFSSGLGSLVGAPRILQVKFSSFSKHTSLSLSLSVLK